MKVISIDPGIMSGYCYAEVLNPTDEAGRKLTYHPFQINDNVDDLWCRLMDFKPNHIIIEDFEFRRGKMAAGGLELFPKELIGVARLYSLLVFNDVKLTDPKSGWKSRLFIQKAAQGKSYYTNPVLKDAGLYVRGCEHGMDASRHLLQWFTFGYGNQFMGKQQLKDFAQITDEMNWWKNG
jgi:hypothetical protein